MLQRVLVVLFLLGTFAPSQADETSTARHLIAGVRAFKAGRYDDALVELRVVAHAPDAPADLAFYLGPTLVKLGRFREAIGVFIASPVERDGLTTFYLGEAYYELKLYRKARGVFVGLHAQGLGPVLEEAANRYVEAVDTVYAAAPVAPTIDAYITQAAELAGNDAIVAAEIYDEARQVEALAAVRHRHAEILAALGATWNTAGRPLAVIETLASDTSVSLEVAWQVARAYATLGDAGHARSLLEAIANQHAARAAEASALLGHLSP